VAWFVTLFWVEANAAGLRHGMLAGAITGRYRH